MFVSKTHLFLTASPDSIINKNLFLEIKPRSWHSRFELSPRKRNVGCANPRRDRPKPLKRIHVATVPLPNARQKVQMSRTLGDDHYLINGCPVCVTVGVAR